MKSSLRILLLAPLALIQACAMLGIDSSGSGSGGGSGRSSGPNGRELFDLDWRFHAGEVQGGQQIAAPATDWETVELPHDFMIEGKGQWTPPPPRAPRAGGPAAAATPAPTPAATPAPADKEGPFDRRSPGGAGNGYLDGGIGWYRKSFTVPESSKGKKVFIDFDGVYMDSEVWLNGQSIGKRPYGYSSFEYDLTPGLKYAPETNVIAVRVNVQQPSSRWYSGAGIYRHVWLTTSEPVHVAHWGTFATTPQVSDANASVRMQTKISNQDKAKQTATLTTVIRDGAGTPVSTATEEKDIEAGKEIDFDQKLAVATPHLWSVDDPYLYQVDTVVVVGGKLMDSYRTPLGIRSYEFTVDKGFFLNGKHVAIQGVCDHHDQGPLGAAAYDRAIERQLEILKTMGCNAIRTSHNPPAPKLLELCDKMGFVVMDEPFDEWLRPKTAMGYGRFFNEWSERDIKDMVLRDRNHPSIIMWSIGNEIPEQSAPNAREMAARLAGFVKETDPTRPTTSAMNNPDPAIASGFAAALDLFGVNYHIPTYATVKGTGKIYGSETSSDLSTRDEYLLSVSGDKATFVKQANGQVTSYDTDAPRWGNSAEDEFIALRKSPWIAGEFVWTGFDYIGEPTPYNWPSRSSYFGIIDICGFPKDRYYLYQSQWQTKPMVHLLPHWTWGDEFKGKAIPVWAYTNADSVELFLNDKSLGARDWKGTQLVHLAWDVPYAPGTLKAVATKDGKVVAADEVKTAGAPAKIVLSADRTKLVAGKPDLSYVRAEIQDANGVRCPNADAEIKYTIGNGGFIAGMDNGDPTNHEPFKGTQHKAFHGLCLAIVRAAIQPGTMTLEATADGLQPARIDIAAQ